MKQPQVIKINRRLTNWVINLHQNGYIDDFLTVNKDRVQCLQNGESFALCHLQVSLVHCCYDLLTHTYQYIHTIDTQVGCRGLLVTNGILPLNNQLS